MAKHVERPIILPISNPTERAEATPQQLIDWTQGQAMIATGSPFPPVFFNGKQQRVAQCNNALVFPGIGIGVIAVKATQVTDNMLWAACVSLNKCAPIHTDPTAPLLPAMESARKSAREIAIAVAEQARLDGVAGIPATADIAGCVDEQIWQPEYLPFRQI
jgi:malate dehydrogenase (oxaloacetate-decarboxylating)